MPQCHLNNIIYIGTHGHIKCDKKKERSTWRVCVSVCDQNEMSVKRQAPTPPVRTLCDVAGMAENAGTIFTTASHVFGFRSVFVHLLHITITSCSAFFCAVYAHR